MASLCHRHRWSNGRSSVDWSCFCYESCFASPSAEIYHDMWHYVIQKWNLNDGETCCIFLVCYPIKETKRVKWKKKWMLFPRRCGLGTICRCLCKTGMTTYAPRSGMFSVFLLSGLHSHGLDLKLLYPPSAHESGCTVARKLSLWHGFASLLATTTSGIMEVESSSACVLISPAPNVSLTLRITLFQISSHCRFQ